MVTKSLKVLANKDMLVGHKFCIHQILRKGGFSAVSDSKEMDTTTQKHSKILKLK